MTSAARGSGAHARLAVVGAVMLLAAAIAVQRTPPWALADEIRAPVVMHVTSALAALDGLTVRESENEFQAGDIVPVVIETEAPVGLLGVTIRLCKTGFTSYTPQQFSYDGADGTRCVKESPPGGIVAPTGLTPDDATYQLGPDSYDGTPQATPEYEFVVGTGHVEWTNASGIASSLDCDHLHPCDIVAEVVTTFGVAYLGLTLDFAEVPDTTTTTEAPTTTVVPSTTVPVTPATVSVAPVSATPTPPAVPASALALTGSGTRDLLSIALLTLAAGLLLLGQALRRRTSG